MITNLGLIIFGLLLLAKGADYLVTGSSSIAKKLGIAPIIIGLTIVAFGTSMPELVVNLVSALKGSTDIAIGNILGSNIANILLILGVTAVISPVVILKNTIHREIPLALLAVLAAGVMANDILFDSISPNQISRTEGLTLLMFFTIFLAYIFAISKYNVPPVEIEPVKSQNIWLSTIMVLGGLGALVLGGNVVVDSASNLARMIGISERIIGLTIVAVGTSLPELFTSVVAALKKESDIAVGNIVGSNIFNVFWILGLTSVIKPLPFSSALNYDVIATIIATIVLVIAIEVGDRHRLHRWEGATFLLLYVAYLVSLALV